MKYKIGDRFKTIDNRIVTIIQTNFMDDCGEDWDYRLHVGGVNREFSINQEVMNTCLDTGRLRCADSIDPIRRLSKHSMDIWP